MISDKKRFVSGIIGLVIASVALVFALINFFNLSHKPSPQSYVDKARQSSEKCSTADLGDDWVNTQPSDSDKLQASSVCAAYWIGRRDGIAAFAKQRK